jgi:hypothetical protein
VDLDILKFQCAMKFLIKIFIVGIYSVIFNTIYKNFYLMQIQVWVYNYNITFSHGKKGELYGIWYFFLTQDLIS